MDDQVELYYIYIYIIQIYSGITCGRVLNGELYTCKLYKLINLCWSVEGIGIFLVEYPRLTLSIAFPLRVLNLGANHIIQIYSGITCGRVLNGELYTCKL